MSTACGPRRGPGLLGAQKLMACSYRKPGIFHPRCRPTARRADRACGRDPFAGSSPVARRRREGAAAQAGGASGRCSFQARILDLAEPSRVTLRRALRASEGLPSARRKASIDQKSFGVRVRPDRTLPAVNGFSVPPARLNGSRCHRAPVERRRKSAHRPPREEACACSSQPFQASARRRSPSRAAR